MSIFSSHRHSPPTPAQQLRCLAQHPPGPAVLAAELGRLAPSLPLESALTLFDELAGAASIADAPVSAGDDATALAHQRFAQRASDIVSELIDPDGSAWNRRVA